MSQLGFDFGAAEPRKLDRVTPARLSTFDGCARRYRMSYVDSPAPKRTGPWAHSTLGAVVHNALRALFALPVVRRTPVRAASLVTEHWKDAGFADAEQARRYRQRAREWVTGYLERNPGPATPAGLERWVSARVNAETGASSEPTLIVEGRADRIDQREGELVIVDYKTGRREPEPADARNAPALALYAVAATGTLRAPCRRVELHHVPTGTVAAAEHTPDELREHLRRAGRTVRDVREATDRMSGGADPDETFPASPGKHCAWCDFRPSCAEGQQAAPAAKPWDLLAP